VLRPKQSPGESDEIFSGRSLLPGHSSSQQFADFLFEGSPMLRGTGLEAHVKHSIDVSDQQARHVAS
jgi:hypothetical protein